jgi:peptidoglycan/LPS O-acetylase OafA/YrhL
MSRHRFHLLDGLRGLAAVVVILWHLPGALHFASLHNGFLAVDFFFCLSGFVIAFSYERRLQSTMGWISFVRARLIRLYPLYFLGMLFGAACLCFDIGAHNVGEAWRFLLVLFLKGALFIPMTSSSAGMFAFPLNDPSWSLSFELAANLLIAWLVVKRLARTPALICITILSLATLTHYCSSLGLQVGWSTRPFDFPLGFARVLLSFTIGVLLLRLSRAFPLRRLQSGSACLVPCAALLLLLFAPWPWMQSTTAQLVLVAVVIPGIIYSAAHLSPPPFLQSACTVAGEISYPLYILHRQILHQLTEPWTGPLIKHLGPHPQRVTFAVLSLSCLVAYAAAKFYDEPLRSWLARSSKQS